MSDYNFDHPEITQEHIQRLQGNPLEACQRENASLRISINSFNHMLLEAKEESEKRLKLIQQVKEERDAAFDEGENYAKEEIGGQLGVLRREKYEAEMKSMKLEKKELETRERLKLMEKDLEDLRKEKEKGANAMEGVDEWSIRLLREENKKYRQELDEAEEMIRGKELHIRTLKEEARTLSPSIAETPPAESERVEALTEQLRVLMAERDDISQQLAILTENLMGTTPKEPTPIETPEPNPERKISAFSASADYDSSDFYGHKRILHGPSPLRQSTTPESDEAEDEEQEKKNKEEKKEEEGEEEEEKEEEEEIEEKVDEREEKLKESIETDENDTSMADYQKDKENWSRRLLDRIKELEKRNMFLERYHDMTHVTRAILSLTPVHFEALRERKESKRREGKILLDVMSKERDSLRKQNRNFEKRLQVLAELRSREKPETSRIQDFLLNQRRWEIDKEAMNTYKKLYEDAEAVMKKMIETGADVDAQEVTELRQERDILKKQKKELEEEIDGPLGLREQLAFSVAEDTEDTEDIDVATQLKRVEAELEWRTKERDTAIEDSKVEENLTSMKELMDQLSRSLEIDVYPSEEKDQQYKEIAKKCQKCQRELSDEKEKVKTLEKFLEDKYMGYENLAGDEHDDSLSARLARTLIELYQVKRKLMERTVQRNSLTKSAVSCLTTVFREIQTLQKKIYTLNKHPDRDPERPLRDVDIENQETIFKLEHKVDVLKKRLNKAEFDIYSAEKRTKKAKDRLDSYLKLSSFGMSYHPRVKELREYRERTPLKPNATAPEVIEHLKTQLKDSDEILDLLAARIDVLTDENGELNTARVEVAEKRLEECMDLVDGPLGQKEAWDNLKELLAEVRQVLKVKTEQWEEKDEERNRALENLESLLKESEESVATLAELLYVAQEDMKREGTQGNKIAELEEQLRKNGERIRDILREKEEHKAEADGLETFLRASETHTTQLEEQLSKNEEKIRGLQQEKDNHKAEAERLDDLLKASETKTAESSRALRNEEEEQYREEIERLHELLLLNEKEDEQYREEIERLYELHTASEEKVSELLEISLATSTRLSELDAEIARWKSVSGESIGEIDRLQRKLEDLEAEIELLHLANNEDAETQTEIEPSNDMGVQSEKPESPLSAVPPSRAPKSKRPKKKAAKKKAPQKKLPDSQYNPKKDAVPKPSDKELEEPKPPKPTPKPNISIRREIAYPAPSPSPAPSLTIKIKSKAHATKKKVERRQGREYDPTWRAGGEEELDEDIPAEEVVQESPVEEQKMEVEGPRRSRRTRNENPVYTGEFILEGPGRGQKRKAVVSEAGARGKRGKK